MIPVYKVWIANAMCILSIGICVDTLSGDTIWLVQMVREGKGCFQKLGSGAFGAIVS